MSVMSWMNKKKPNSESWNTPGTRKNNEKRSIYADLKWTIHDIRVLKPYKSHVARGLKPSILERQNKIITNLVVYLLVDNVLKSLQQNSKGRYATIVQFFYKGVNFLNQDDARRKKKTKKSRPNKWLW
jgi:hypothetical protein